MSTVAVKHPKQSASLYAGVKRFFPDMRRLGPSVVPDDISGDPRAITRTTHKRLKGRSFSRCERLEPRTGSLRFHEIPLYRPAIRTHHADLGGHSTPTCQPFG